MHEQQSAVSYGRTLQKCFIILTTYETSSESLKFAFLGDWKSFKK